MSNSKPFLKLFISFLVLSLSLPAYAGDCDSMCGITKENAKSMINDATCKNDPSCTDCVVNALTGSQAGAYCSAYNKSEKGKGGQIFSAAINTAATITCGVACAMSSTPAGGPAWNKVCGFSGLAVTATEVGYTIANLIEGKDADLLSLASQAISVRGAAKAAFGKKATDVVPGVSVATGAGEGVKEVAKESVKKTEKKAKSFLKNPACWNVVQYGIAAAAKISSISKMAKASASTCSSAQSLAGAANGTIQSCLASKMTTPGASGGAQSFFAVTTQNFISPTLDDVDRIASTSGSDKYLRELKSDMQFAQNQGKFDLDKIAKRIANGESVSSIMADAGLPQSSIDLVKDSEARIKAGDSSKFLASIAGTDAYSLPEGGETAVAANGEMSFGSADATPGEGAEILDVGRKLASDSAALGVGSDGDVFHATFGGSIFDIVSLRIQGSKNSYAELEPASRMNRVFNGYSDPTRAPASSDSKISRGRK